MEALPDAWLTFLGAALGAAVVVWAALFAAAAERKERRREHFVETYLTKGLEIAARELMDRMALLSLALRGFQDGRFPKGSVAPGQEHTSFELWKWDELAWSRVRAASPVLWEHLSRMRANLEVIGYWVYETRAWLSRDPPQDDRSREILVVLPARSYAERLDEIGKSLAQIISLLDGVYVQEITSLAQLRAAIDKSASSLGGPTLGRGRG